MGVRDWELQNSSGYQGGACGQERGKQSPGGWVCPYVTCYLLCVICFGILFCSLGYDLLCCYLNTPVLLIPNWSDEMQCCRSYGALFYYQPLCIQPTGLILGLFFFVSKIFQFDTPPPPQANSVQNSSELSICPKRETPNSLQPLVQVVGMVRVFWKK